MRPLPLLLVGALGCDAVFGIRHLDSPADAPTDASETLVTGHYYTRVVTNDSQRKPVLAEVPEQKPFTAILDDGTSVDLTLDSDGRFSFERARVDQAYRLFTNDHAFEVQHTASHLELAEHVYGRLDREIPTSPTTLTYTITNLVPGAAYINTTGLWTATQVPSAMMFTLDWTMATVMSGGPGLLRVDRNDRTFYILDQDVGGYTATIGYRADDITLTNGAMPAISGPFQATARDQCINVVAKNAALSGRLDAVGMTGPKLTSWIVRATPIASMGPRIGFATASHSPGEVDEDINVMTANPYPGHELVLSNSMFRFHTLLAPGATSPTALYEGSQIYVQPATSCAVPSVLDGGVGLPHLFAIDGAALTGNNQAVTAPRPGSIRFTFTTDTGTAHRYHVQLFELVITPTMGTGIAFVTLFVSPQPSVSIDSSLLAAGKTYVLIVSAEIGIPNAASGDYATNTYPFGTGIQLTPTFTIQN